MSQPTVRFASALFNVYIPILKGTELEESAEEENPNERKWQPKEFHRLNTIRKCPSSFLISCN